VCYQLRPQTIAETGDSERRGATPLLSRKRGPLQPGNFMVLGTFEELLRVARQAAGEGGEAADDVVGKAEFVELRPAPEAVDQSC
jgi:hypothetical protein